MVINDLKRNTDSIIQYDDGGPSGEADIERHDDGGPSGETYVIKLYDDGGPSGERSYQPANIRAGAEVGGEVCLETNRYFGGPSSPSSLLAPIESSAVGNDGVAAPAVFDGRKAPSTKPLPPVRHDEPTLSDASASRPLHRPDDLGPVDTNNGNDNDRRNLLGRNNSNSIVTDYQHLGSNGRSLAEEVRITEYQRLEARINRFRMKRRIYRVLSILCTLGAIACGLPVAQWLFDGSGSADSSISLAVVIGSFLGLFIHTFSSTANYLRTVIHSLKREQETLKKSA